MRRRLASVALVACTIVVPTVPAGAVDRPGTDGPLPEGSTRPEGRVTLGGPCRTTSSTPVTPTTAPRWARTATLRSVWLHGRGAGQTVAVIDTGVNPGPRLPTVRGGGDLVAGKDGLDDCDAHGTLVAGIVAATPDAVSGTSGVAPDARVLSIRQSSSVFRGERTPGQDDSVPTGGVGTLRTLARAVRAAADAGATVINVSEVACVPAGTALADSTLGSAVRYAAAEKDVVIVAAAGNLGSPCSGQNPSRPDALRPGDDGWADVTTVATPAWYDGLVLAVGAVDETGAPAPFSLHGPWVDVAAPGTGIVSVGADGGGTATRVVAADGSSTAVEGTSFAAPFVSGVAALVRQAHPRLSAREVITRIRNTAIPSPGGRDFVTGSGVVDPVAAVSAAVTSTAGEPASIALTAPPADQRGSWPVGVIVTVVVVTVGALTLGGAATVRALRGRRRAHDLR